MLAAIKNWNYLFYLKRTLGSIRDFFINEVTQIWIIANPSSSFFCHTKITFYFFPYLRNVFYEWFLNERRNIFSNVHTYSWKSRLRFTNFKILLSKFLTGNLTVKNFARIEHRDSRDRWISALEISSANRLNSWMVLI